MELLELIFSIPGLVEAVLHVCWAVWWLVRGIARVIAAIGRAIGRGCGWLVDRVRRDRDFPAATVVRAGRVGRRSVPGAWQEPGGA